MTKLIVASRNFVKRPSNRMVHGEEYRRTSSRPIAGPVPEFSGQTVSVEANRWTATFGRQELSLTRHVIVFDC